MTIPVSRSFQAMINDYLDKIGIPHAGASADQRATGLSELTAAYRKYLRGVYTVNDGTRPLKRHHLWSFLHPASANLTITDDGTGDYEYTVAVPADFGGVVEDLRWPYDSAESKAGYTFERISPEAFDAKRRDWSGETDTPKYWCLRGKAFSPSTGTQYEIAVHPPAGETIILLLRNRTDPADPTDSASCYPMGYMGCEELIVGLALAEFELQRGQVLGPFNQDANDLFHELVTEDKALYPTETVQTSMADEETGNVP